MVSLKPQAIAASRGNGGSFLESSLLDVQVKSFVAEDKSMDFIITGEPSDEGLSQLIDSLLNFIIENQLYEDVGSAVGTGHCARVNGEDMDGCLLP